jgi:hypothetical protein
LRDLGDIRQFEIELRRVERLSALGRMAAELAQIDRYATLDLQGAPICHR